MHTHTYIYTTSKLCRYTESDEGTTQGDDLKLALHNYTQSVLDSTYFQECKLSSAEFKHETSLSQVIAVIHALSKPAQLCGSSTVKVEEMLGTELLECVYWRVGALLYMLCHSMFEGGEERRRGMDRDVFLKVRLLSFIFIQNMLGYFFSILLYYALMSLWLPSMYMRL